LLTHFDYHEDISKDSIDISKDSIDAGKLIINLQRRPKGLAEEELRRLPQWLRYRRRDPNNPVLMQAICRYLEMIGEMDEAEAELKDLLETCPNWWLAQYQAGRLCGLKGGYDEAIPYFSRAVALRGDKAAGYLGLACTYSLTHKHKEAISNLEILESSDELVESYGQFENWKILDDEDFNNIKEDPEYKNLFFSVVQRLEDKVRKQKILRTPSSVGG
jgi:tetratricopeptide (TPR) repeat protein